MTDAVPTLDPATFLTETADFLEKQGVYKGYLHDGNPNPTKRCYCTLGAMHAVFGSKYDDRNHAVQHANFDLMESTKGILRDLIEPVLGSPSIPDWNDDPERPAEEIIATIRKAAEIAGAEK